MSLVEGVISFIAPHDCLLCSAEGTLLCVWCRQEYLSPIPERCFSCQKRTVGSAVCLACRRKSPLKQVWVATEYKGAAKQLIHVLKFERASAAARPAAQAMADALPFLSEDILIVPVPAATSRVRLRGYDQAVLLAKQLNRLLRRRQIRLLKRVGQHRQVGASRKQRKSQLETAFRAVKPELAKGAHILLVDDVLTTGATLEAAARTLKRAGAKRIDAVVFAQRP